MFKAKHLVLALAILGGAAPATDAADATAQLKTAKAAYDRKDYEKAQEIWQPLAESGNLSAQYNLAVLLRNKEDIVNQVKGRQWFEKAAAAGHVKAQYALGQLYEKGEGVERDYGKARQWYEKAAEAGHAKAQYALGSLYEDGLGVDRDEAKAREWYGKAAAQGHKNAQLARKRLQD